jgi:hypothetical protein
MLMEKMVMVQVNSISHHQMLNIPLPTGRGESCGYFSTGREKLQHLGTKCIFLLGVFIGIFLIVAVSFTFNRTPSEELEIIALRSHNGHQPSIGDSLDSDNMEDIESLVASSAENLTDTSSTENHTGTSATEKQTDNSFANVGYISTENNKATMSKVLLMASSNNGDQTEDPVSSQMSRFFEYFFRRISSLPCNPSANTCNIFISEQKTHIILNIVTLLKAIKSADASTNPSCEFITMCLLS